LLGHGEDARVRKRSSGIHVVFRREFFKHPGV
jgi:hypothetical protein